MLLEVFTMRWFVLAAILGAGMLLAQEGRRSQPSEKPEIKKAPPITIELRDGWVYINGRRVAKKVTKGPLTVVVMDGKVYLNGREMKVPPAPPLKRERSRITPLEREMMAQLGRVRALLRRYWEELPEGLKEALERLRRLGERLPRTPEELKKGTERWHREMRRWLGKLEEMLPDEAKERFREWLKKAPEEWTKRFRRGKVRGWIIRPVEEVKKALERVPDELRPFLEEIKRLDAQIEHIRRRLDWLLRRLQGDEEMLRPRPHRRAPLKKEHPEHHQKRLGPRFPKRLGGWSPFLRRGIKGLRLLLENMKPEDVERFMKMLEEMGRNLEPEDMERLLKILKKLLSEQGEKPFPQKEEEEEGF